MTQPPSAEVVPSEAMAAQRTADPALAPRNRRAGRLLIVLVAIPAVLALVLTGFWVAGATRSAGAYGQVGRLAAVGQQVTGLARAMADERSGTATFISEGRPTARLAALHQQYAITDARAAEVRRLVSQLGNGYPAQTRANAAQVLASIAKLPGLRRQAIQSQASPLAAVTGYSAAISGLLPINDGIADLSDNPTLITSVRALGSLSRMLDHASQQQAILAVALAEGRFGPGALTALTTAQAQEASDQALFGTSATPDESRALTATLASPKARQAQAVEEQAIAAGQASPGPATPPKGALALGPRASQQWSAGMSDTIGWMGQAQQQLAEWITADSRSQQNSTTQSALVTGGAALGVLALILLGTIFAARSWVRRRRRLEPAALESPQAPLAITAGDVSAGFSLRSHSLLEELLRQIDSMELSEDDPERLAKLFEMDHLATRIWRNSDSALVLGGHEPPRPAGPLPLVDVLRAAASEIEEYGRVILDVQQGVYLSGSAATDTVHLLAELLENATTFSPETTQVIVSGHAMVGGGSLVTITDGGPGMSDEELALFNWQLDNPAPADTAVARRMGLFAVALLAARHGITVTLSGPLDGGTTAEVYLPAALISLGNVHGSWQGRAAEASLTRASDEADARVMELPVRFASGPESPRALETDEPETDEPEAGEPEAVPAMVAAPVPSPAPETSIAGTEPDPVDADPVDGPPIFESVRSGHLHSFGSDLPHVSEQQVSQPPAEQPAGPPASWGEGNGHVRPPTAGPPPSPGLPQHIPEPGQVRGATVDQQTEQAPAAESAETVRDKLAGFQRGSRRARATAEMNRSAPPGQDG